MKIAVVLVILACCAIAGAVIGLVRLADKYDPWN